MNITSDFLVIGSGVAGLTFALKVAAHGTVTIVTKKAVSESNTAYAQGGVAAVQSDIDSFDLHIQDTLDAGDGLCNRDVVDMVVTHGPERVKELIDLGVKFSLCDDDAHKAPGTDYDLGREGGHSEKRVLHAEDMTGREIERALVAQIKNTPGITLLEEHIAIDLITLSTRVKSGMITTTRDTTCCGAYVLDKAADTVKTITAKVTVLACGGSGKVYLYTSNPDVATGDGIAMAWRAGASVANMEFMQFHPTCLYHPDAKNFLISEAVRGEGAVLKNEKGEPFMEKYDPLKDLACRDKVSRAIDTELKTSGADSVFLDISHKDPAFVKKRFPNLWRQGLKFGFDMTKDPIPVVPAAHYMCGGVATDLDGRSDIKHLYAIGETACTGLHGANRLASNSLLEALVYAHNAANRAIEDAKAWKATDVQLPRWDDVGATDSDEVSLLTTNWDEIRRFMWNYVGVVRSDKRLSRALNRIENIQSEIREYYWNFRVTADLIELRNIAVVAELIIRSAMKRRESRGLHYTINCPEKNDAEWLRETVLKRTLTNI
ncbi:L-aspartate oxidase [Desulfoluna spongiiphila]|uniref:L-aspartate oxidase n=1 Tax=Desulfoluna spongiiphila TaxID=419481 RepID=A0A1G5CZJ5_9BACT|nr:L-aspartate oxidase [Desulfoluna spongiiphila]SCY07620.1 L-aspartate oxidase [Desulfoluna spongiiphila]VVS92491.1 l-aspartate oxidase [Desulfoluna spongiiphila]